MVDYTKKVQDELLLWKQKMTRRTGMISRFSKGAQTKVNGLIPKKVHHVMTESIKNMVKATLLGSNLTTKRQQAIGLSLYERDELFKSKLSAFRKTAVIEGAGTGAGGIMLGLADFPLLLSIKIKFLFEAASVYGYDTNEYEERLFILHVFKLAFSSEEKRKETLDIIERLGSTEAFDRRYGLAGISTRIRDYIDLVKMFQLIPGFGAIVGAFANYNLLDQLGETAMNCYRLRTLQQPK